MATKVRATKPRKFKAPKDLNAPKKNLSAYFLFTNQRRQELKVQYPEKKLTELTTLMAVEWKAMDAVTKKKYQDQADADKKDYLQKMEEYKRTSNYTQYQVRLSTFKQEQKLTADKLAAKKPKDRNAPKKPPTAYFLFTAKIRKETTAANPDMKITQIAKVMGQKWKEISEEEKKQFYEEAARLKEEHKNTVADYERSAHFAAYKQKVAAWEAEQEAKKQEAKQAKTGDKSPVRPKVSLPRKPKDPKAPKKPLTAYLLFSGSVRSQSMAENPELKITQIAKVIGQKWKALTDEERKKWTDLSVKQKEEYKITAAQYQQSEDFAAFKAKLAEWEAECVKRKEKANALFVKKMQKMKMSPKEQKKPKMSKKHNQKVKPMKKKYHDRRDSYDSDSSSYSTSSTGSRSYSSGSSSYSSSSSSYSD